MRPAWQLAVGAALAYRIYLMIRGEQMALSQAEEASPKGLEIAALSLLGIAPFALSALIGIEHPTERPPPG